MWMRLIISEPDAANSSASGCSVKPASVQVPNHNRSPTAPSAAPAVNTHHESERRRNRRSLEVLDLPRAFRQRLRGHVVAREPRHAARDEIGQDDSVVRTLQAAGIAEHGGRGAERDHVRERIELAAERGGLLAPACDAAVEDVENEGREDQPACRIHVPTVPRLHVLHAREQRSRAADGIAERKPVRHVEVADHREGFAAGHLGHGGVATARASVAGRPAAASPGEAAGLRGRGGSAAHGAVRSAMMITGRAFIALVQGSRRTITSGSARSHRYSRIRRAARNPSDSADTVTSRGR